MYAWETLFQHKLNAIRNKELKLLRKIAYINAISAVTWFISPFLVCADGNNDQLVNAAENTTLTLIISS